MSRDIIETIEHKGFIIQVIPDYDYQMDSDEGMGQLHCDSRDLYIGAIRKDGKEVKKPISIKYSISEILNILETSHIFYGTYGSHSGQWLNAMRGEITVKEITQAAKALYKKDNPTKADREYQSFEDYIYDMSIEDLDLPGIDNQKADVLLIIPRDLWGNKKQSAHDIAKGIWQYYDDCIQGNVYGYNIVDKDGDDIDGIENYGGSCWGFVGGLYNYGAKSPADRDGYMIKEAKNIIDAINAKEYYKTKYKKQIADHTDSY